MNRGRALGLAAVTLTSLLWGTTGTAATFAPEIGPLAIGAFALGIGGLLQAAISVPALRRSMPALHTRLPSILIGGIAVAVYPLAFYSSMHLAGVAAGSVVSLASAPLASGVLERVIDRRPLSRWWMLAALLGIIGSALLCFSKIESEATSLTSTLSGIGLGLIAGVAYATYSWASHGLMAHNVERGAAMGSVFGIGGVLLLPVVVITGAPVFASPANLGVALYMALIPMFLGYVLFGYGLTKMPASTATTVTLTEPAVATILAVLIVGETLSGLGWIGLAVISVVLTILAVAPTNVSSTSRDLGPTDQLEGSTVESRSTPH